MEKTQKYTNIIAVIAVALLVAICIIASATPASAKSKNAIISRSDDQITAFSFTPGSQEEKAARVIRQWMADAGYREGLTDIQAFEEKFKFRPFLEMC